MSERVRKSKSPTWQPGSQFESDVAENQLASAYDNMTINMHMKFEIEIPKQTWLTLCKPCRLQWPDKQTDGQDESSNTPLQLCWAGV